MWAVGQGHSVPRGHPPSLPLCLSAAVGNLTSPPSHAQNLTPGRALPLRGPPDCASPPSLRPSVLPNTPGSWEQAHPSHTPGLRQTCTHGTGRSGPNLAHCPAPGVCADGRWNREEPCDCPVTSHPSAPRSTCRRGAWASPSAYQLPSVCELFTPSNSSPRRAWAPGDRFMSNPFYTPATARPQPGQLWGTSVLRLFA